MPSSNPVDCMLILDKEDYKFAAILNFSSGSCFQVENYSTDIIQLNDSSRICLSSNDEKYYIYSKHTGEKLNTLGFENLMPYSFKYKSQTKNILFAEWSPRVYKIYNFEQEKVIVEKRFNDDSPLRRHSTYLDSESVNFYPKYLTTDINKSTFLSISLNDKSERKNSVTLNSKYAFVTSSANSHVYYSSINYNLLIISFEGEILFEYKVEGVSTKSMIGYTLGANDTLYLLYQVSSGARLLSVDLKSYETCIKEIKLPKNNFKKIDLVKINYYNNQIIHYGNSIDVNTGIVQKINFSNKLNWYNVILKVLDCGTFIIEDFKHGSGTNNGFTLGSFNETKQIDFSSFSKLPCFQ